jgi:hypothetical protein
VANNTICPEDAGEPPKYWALSDIRLFNRLPMPIRSLRKDRISFKNNLVSYLMNNSFYADAEFLERTANN